MDEPTTCPRCAQPNVYPDGERWVCADCAHEWSLATAPAAAAAPEDDGVVVVLIKSLKVKGSSVTLKQGTKITNIRLADGDHAVDCKVDNLSVMLKAEFLRKA